ncbi:MAG: hypothetical protein QGH60_13085 [Phycisphaerae bacterium]|jgi:hypothetical protein|nr:hypothetical protein [Phycisphaerae bacterium]
MATVLAFCAISSSSTTAAEKAKGPAVNVFGNRQEAAKMLIAYFERMSRPKPLVVRTGDRFQAHRKDLRRKLLACAGLQPLPKRVALDVRSSPAIEHEWCRITRVYYQLWPNVYSSGLLFMPKKFVDRPAPAVLCPHGHWPKGNAHAEVQRRCLVLAKMGYVVFSPAQSHYEDPALGISHQTLMIWNNIRALDYLQTLPQVDGKRIGCAGCSGGGLQTQMLVAVDDRVKAASICGMTCDYREIIFPGRNHCRCNHFPNIMRYTDEPEISTLGLPVPVQYLTMNDWTRSFEKNNYPTIRRLYEANGAKGRTDCKYWSTPHSYDKPKRQRMYWWMEKWLRGKDRGGPITEGEVKTPSVQAILKLKASVPNDKGLAHISRVHAKMRYVSPKLTSRKEWEAYRHKMLLALGELLGTPLPPQGKVKLIGTENRDGLVIERLLCPSEGGLSVPTLVLRPDGRTGKLPAVIIYSDRGKVEAMAAGGDNSPAALARSGKVVVLPDVRFTGELSLGAFAGLSGKLTTFKPCSPLGEGRANSFPGVWRRNAMLWGRPVAGMAATDILAVVNYVATRKDVEQAKLSLVARGRTTVVSLLAAVLDPRIKALDADLASRCFADRKAPMIPFVLRHGDVLQWSALLADRKLKLAGLPEAAGDPKWLKDVFRAAGNPRGLRLVGTKEQ